MRPKTPRQHLRKCFGLFGEYSGILRSSKVVVRPDGQVEAPGKVATQHDQPLLVALTQAFYWQQLLDGGLVVSGS